MSQTILPSSAVTRRSPGTATSPRRASSKSRSSSNGSDARAAPCAAAVCAEGCCPSSWKWVWEFIVAFLWCHRGLRHHSMTTCLQHWRTRFRPGDRPVEPTGCDDGFLAGVIPESVAEDQGLDHELPVQPQLLCAVTEPEH